MLFYRPNFFWNGVYGVYLTQFCSRYRSTVFTKIHLINKLNIIIQIKCVFQVYVYLRSLRVNIVSNIHIKMCTITPWITTWSACSYLPSNWAWIGVIPLEPEEGFETSESLCYRCVIKEVISVSSSPSCHIFIYQVNIRRKCLSTLNPSILCVVRWMQPHCPCHTWVEVPLPSHTSECQRTCNIRARFGNEGFGVSHWYKGGEPHGGFRENMLFRFTNNVITIGRGVTFLRKILLPFAIKLVVLKLWLWLCMSFFWMELSVVVLYEYRRNVRHFITHQ